MTKMVEATCVGGVVTVDNMPIPDAEMTGQGIGPSSGVALLDGPRVVYVPLQGTDLKMLITTLGQIVTQVSLIATALDAVTLSPGASTALNVQLMVMQAQLVAMGEQLQ